MKKFSLLFVSLFLLACTAAHATIPFRMGTYELRGSNNESGTLHYRGEVTIQQQGSNYGLAWKIGSNQNQLGVAILNGDVLSVAYFDKNSHNGGVVSFQIVADGQLEGQWAPFYGTGFGRETLIWKHY